MNKFNITKYVLYDIIRNKWLITYFIIFFLISLLLTYFSGTQERTISSLLNVVLIVIPLVCLVFASMYYYNSRDFIQMLLTQPVERKNIFFSEYLGLSISLTSAYLLGILFPVVSFGITIPILILVIVGIFLIFIFTSLSMLFAIKFDDKLKGLGLILFIWLFLSVIYDGLLLYLYYLLADYPIENFTVIFALLNPVDISRIAILMTLDLSAMMGLTGAAFLKFFGNPVGIIISLVSLIVWVILPVFLASKNFYKKNF
ncbi:MAG: ABC transporter permease [Ignavibacteria bacterium]